MTPSDVSVRRHEPSASNPHRRQYRSASTVKTTQVEVTNRMRDDGAKRITEWEASYLRGYLCGLLLDVAVLPSAAVDDAAAAPKNARPVDAEDRDRLA